MQSRPNSNGFLASTLAVMLLVFAAVMATAQDLVPVSPPVAAFVDAVNGYTQMHRRIERTLPPMTINATPESINRTIQALAAGIRAERPDAKLGDFFTPALAHELRARVNDALLDHGFTAADVHASERVDGVDPTTVHLRVNATFPWLLGTAMFPCVIEALPPLPPELQYRIVGNDLVLIDIHASLVVDVLPNVLADATMRNQPEGAIQ